MDSTDFFPMTIEGRVISKGLSDDGNFKVLAYLPGEKISKEFQIPENNNLNPLNEGQRVDCIVSGRYILRDGKGDIEIEDICGVRLKKGEGKNRRFGMRANVESEDRIFYDVLFHDPAYARKLPGPQINSARILLYWEDLPILKSDHFAKTRQLPIKDNYSGPLRPGVDE
jgi:hypothetical protein